MSVLFPAPLGPTSATYSPGRTCNDTPSISNRSEARRPYAKRTRSNSTSPRSRATSTASAASPRVSWWSRIEHLVHRDGSRTKRLVHTRQRRDGGEHASDVPEKRDQRPERDRPAGNEERSVADDRDSRGA